MNNYDVIVVGAGPAGIFLCHELKKLKSTTRILWVMLGREHDIHDLSDDETMFLRKLEPLKNVTGDKSTDKIYQYLGETKVEQIAKNVFLTYSLYANPKDKEFPVVSYIKNCEELAKKYDMTLKCEKTEQISSLQLRCLYQSIKERFQYLGVDVINGEFACDFITNDGKIAGVEITSSKNKESKTQYYAPKVAITVGAGCRKWLQDKCNELNIPTLPGRVDIGVRYEFSADVLGRQYIDNNFTFSSLGYTVMTDEVITTPVTCNGFVSTVHDANLGMNLVTVKSGMTNNANVHTKNYSLGIRCLYSPFDYEDDQKEELKRIAEELNYQTENGIVVQRFGDVMASVLKDKRIPTEEDLLKKNTITPSLKMAVAGDVTQVLGASRTIEVVNMISALDNLFPGFANSDNLLYAPDIHVYPRRVEVSDKFETILPGLYCVGDLAQITSPGLISSSVSGACLAHILSEEN